MSYPSAGGTTTDRGPAAPRSLPVGIPGLPWALALGFGILTIAIGLVLAFWPTTTLVVVTVITAVELVLAGVFRLVSAVATAHSDTSTRVFRGLSGALAVLAGLLCLRAPVRTLLFVGLLVGGWMVVTGLLDILAGATGTGSHSRLWSWVMGGIGVVVGGYLLVNPRLSLAALVLATCVWLFVYGAAAIVMALQERSAEKRLEAGSAATTA